MIRIAIIGAGIFQFGLIEKANLLGYETLVFAWEDGAVAKGIANHFYPVSITDKDQILSICEEMKISGIVTCGSDLAVITVNYVAEKLGLIGNSMESTFISTNKYAMREAFKKCSLPIPAYHVVETNENVDLRKFSNELCYIVKPTDRSGSRGICKVTNISEIPAAIERAREASFSKQVLIEEFVDGEEYSMEMVSWDGVHTHLATTEKFTTGAPGFVETAHLQPARIDSEKEAEVIVILKQALDCLGVKCGASHSEFKIDSTGAINIIEIGARMGGDFIGSDLVCLSTGQDFLKDIIEIACGIKPTFSVPANLGFSFVKFIFSEKDVDMFVALKAKNDIEIVRETVSSEAIRSNAKDSSQRGGYYLLRGNNINGVKDLLQNEKNV